MLLIQTFLHLGFLGTSNQSVLEYARNVDVMFASKICRILLGRARDIMKKNLHDMMEVGPIVSEIMIDVILTDFVKLTKLQGKKIKQHADEMYFRIKTF